MPEQWLRVGIPEKYREYVELATGHAQHTYWREHWIWRDDSEPPFPFCVIATDSTESKDLLRRLDQIGIPYDVTYELDAVPGEPCVIDAPLWMHEPAPDPTALCNHVWSSNAPSETEPLARPLDEFFANFRPRHSIEGSPLPGDSAR